MRTYYSFLLQVIIAISTTCPLNAQSIPKQINDAGERCLDSLLGRDSTAKMFFASAAGSLIYSNFHFGVDEVVPAMQTILRRFKIRKRNSLEYRRHSESKGIETGYYLDKKDRRRLIFLTGWTLVNEEWKKVFEFVHPINETIDDSDPFLESRKLWIILCNKHDPARLTSELYLDDAIYFSYGSQYTGPQAIAKKYAYMRDPEYSLNLTPLLTFLLDDASGVEVGRYTNQRNDGLYVIIWKRRKYKWKIALDFNF